MKIPNLQDNMAPKHVPLNIAEWIVVAALMVATVFLHIYNFTHAGALWRDESTSVGLATMPTFSELWANFQYDSVPLVWIGILRTLHAVGIDSDPWLRLLGLSVGLTLVAVLWLNARRMNITIPFLSLALLGLSPTIIRWGDSLRAYGIGIALMLITFSLVWTYATSPSRLNFLAATASAILSVHSLYLNMALLFAICSAGAILTASHRQWRRMVGIFSIGFIAAISMLIYMGPIKKENDWLIVILQPDAKFRTLFARFVEALSMGGNLMPWLWAALCAGIIVVSSVCVLNPKALRASTSQRDLGIYALATILIGTLAYAAFLKQLRYITFAWHYPALLALIAVAMDAGFNSLRNFAAGRVAHFAVALTVLLLTFQTALKPLSIRLTNVDLAATVVSKNAAPEDLVLVSPWYAGISLHRYYHGPAPWLTLPVVDDHRVHRYDVIKEKMALADQTLPVQPVLEKMEETLRAGHRVYVVGGLHFMNAGETFQIPAAAPGGGFGWNDAVYLDSWSIQAANFLQIHALKGQQIPVPASQNINPYEDLPLIVLEGWQNS